jgi:hypothetical protein
MVKKTGLYINIALHASMQDISPLTKKKEEDISPLTKEKSLQYLLEGLKFLLVFVLLALVLFTCLQASDPSPLRDLCVAINETDGGICF